MIEMPLSAFGSYYRSLRIISRYSVSKVSQDTGIPQDRITEIEEGIAPDMNEVTMMMLAIYKDPPKLIFY